MRRVAESGAANGRYGVNIASTSVVIARISNNDVSDASTARYGDTSLTAIVTDPNLSLTVALTADNQAVASAFYNFIKLTSDNATAANRTFTLNPGQYTGQRLTLIFDDTDACQLLDDAATSPAGGTMRLNGNWEPTEDDTISLIWDDNEWMELSRSAN
jgi:hypothetical protein